MPNIAACPSQRQEEEEGFCGPFPLPENTRGLVAQVLSPDFRAKWETERCHMGRVGAASEIQAPSECSCFLWMKECYALGTHPEIVQAVKETTGLSELVLHKMDLMELPPGGMEAFHVDIETADCQADAVVLVGLPMLAIAPPVGVAQSLLAMAAVQAVRGRAFFLKGQASSRNFLEKALLAQLQRQGVPNLTVSSVLNGARDMAIFRSATWHAVINPTNKTRRAVAMRFASPTCSIRSMLSFSLLSNKTEVQRSSITPPVLLVTKGTTTVTHGNNSEDNDVRRWRSFQGEMPSSPLINHMPHHRHHHHDDHDEDRDDGDDDRDRGLCRLRQGGSPPRNETWGAEFLMRAKTRRSSALFSAEDDETTSSTDLNISSTLLGRTDIVAAVSATIISCSKRNKVLSPLHFHEEGELIFVLLGKIVALKFSHMDSRIREKAMVTNGSMLFLPSNTLHMIVSNDNYTKVVSIRWRPHRNHDHDDDGGVQQPTGSLTQQQQKQQVDPHCSSSRDTPSSPSHYQGTQVGPVRPHFHQRCIKGLGGISAYSYRMLPERALDPGARQGYDVVVVPLSGAAIVFPEGGWIKEHMVGLVPALTSHVLWNPKKASKIFNSTSFMLQEDDNNSVTMLIVEIHAPGIRVLGGHDDVERFVGAVMLGAQFDHMRR